MYTNSPLQSGALLVFVFWYYFTTIRTSRNKKAYSVENSDLFAVDFEFAVKLRPLVKAAEYKYLPMSGEDLPAVKATTNVVKILKLLRRLLLSRFLWCIGFSVSA